MSDSAEPAHRNRAVRFGAVGGAGECFANNGTTLNIGVLHTEHTNLMAHGCLTVCQRSHMRLNTTRRGRVVLAQMQDSHGRALVPLRAGQIRLEPRQQRPVGARGGRIGTDRIWAKSNNASDSGSHEVT